MNFKPSDFFIGLMEFFSIFLPGFIVVFLFRNKLHVAFPMEGVSDKDVAPSIAYYFLASYIFGHFVNGIGGFLFELRHPIKHVFFSKHLPFKRFANFKAKVEAAKKIMKENLGLKSGDNADMRIHFQNWADIIIQIKKPELMTTVRQFEADAKFFRNFTIVSLLLLIPFFNDKNFHIYYGWRIVTVLISILLHMHWKYEAIKEEINIILTLDKLGLLKKCADDKAE